METIKREYMIDKVCKSKDEILLEILERMLADILLEENKNDKNLAMITIPISLFKDLAGTKIKLLQDIVKVQKEEKKTNES